MTKAIKLTKGFHTFVDDQDYEELVRFRWFATKRSTSVYAARDASRKDGGKRIYMHRAIMKAPATRQVDHVNGDGLDNRRENLRLATPKQNMENRTVPARTESGYRGVRRVSPGTFHAYVNTGGHQIYLGCWRSALRAATARDFEIVRIGSRARLNFDKPLFTAAELAATRTESPKSKTGHPNIRFKLGAYEACIRRNGKRIYVGRFATLEEALEAQRP